jgi:hypothetical protein
MTAVIKRVVICLLVNIILSKGSAQVHQNAVFEGTYISRYKYYKGVLMAFNLDSTFIFSYRGHINADTAAGKYVKKGDTILLQYLFNNYDSIFASYRSRGAEPPVDELFSAAHATLRPGLLLRKRKKLYYLDKHSLNFNKFLLGKKKRKIYLIRYR